jgi:hypothetical protein
MIIKTTNLSKTIHHNRNITKFFYKHKHIQIGKFSQIASIVQVNPQYRETVRPCQKLICILSNTNFQIIMQEAPREYAEVIAQCWHDEPNARPEFSVLLRPLMDLYDSLNPGSRLTMSASSLASTVAGSAGLCPCP